MTWYMAHDSFSNCHFPFINICTCYLPVFISVDFSYVVMLLVLLYVVNTPFERVDAWSCCSVHVYTFSCISNEVRPSLTCLTPAVSSWWGKECLRLPGWGFSTTSQPLTPFSTNSSSSSPTDSKRLLPPEPGKRHLISVHFIQHILYCVHKSNIHCAALCCTVQHCLEFACQVPTLGPTEFHGCGAAAGAFGSLPMTFFF